MGMFESFVPCVRRCDRHVRRFPACRSSRARRGSIRATVVSRMERATRDTFRDPGDRKFVAHRRLMRDGGVAHRTRWTARQKVLRAGCPGRCP